MSGNPSYRKGAEFEREVANDQRALGCLVVRAGGSKSGSDEAAFDLVSILPSDVPAPRVALIECKTTGRLDPGPKKKLIELAERYGAMPILAKRGKPGARKKRTIEYVMLA